MRSFRSTNSNPQDFIPHLRYLSKSERSATATEVRGRRDRWLATMLEGARQNVGKQSAAKKTVAEMLLTDNNEGLTEREYSLHLFLLLSRRLALTAHSGRQNNPWRPHVWRV